MVGRVFICLLTAFVGALGCSPSEAPKPVPTVAPVATLTPVANSIVTSPTPTSSAPKLTPNPGAGYDLNDFSDTADWEWNLAEEAEDADFEIDADATSFYMPAGNIVTFKVKALNGTPPYTCKWDFADGSPEQEGMMLKHQFTRALGRIDLKVFCTEASGASAMMRLGLGVADTADWASRMGIEMPSPTPATAVTP
jgi:hypothetical protein